MGRAGYDRPGSVSGPGGGGSSAVTDILTDANDPLDALRFVKNSVTGEWDFSAVLRALRVQAKAYIRSTTGTITIEAAQSWQDGAAGNGMEIGLRDREIPVTHAQASAAVTLTTGTMTVGMPRSRARGAAGNAWAVRVEAGTEPVPAVAATTVIQSNLRMTAGGTGTGPNGLRFRLNITANATRSVTWDSANRLITCNIPTTDSFGTFRTHWNDGTGGLVRPQGTPSVVAFVIDETTHANQISMSAGVFTGTLAGGTDRVVGDAVGAVVDAANSRVVVTVYTSTNLATIQNSLTNLGFSVSLSSGAAGPFTLGDFGFTGGVTGNYAPPLGVDTPEAEARLWAASYSDEVGIRVRPLPSFEPGAGGNAISAVVSSSNNPTSVTWQAGNFRLLINVNAANGTMQSVLNAINADSRFEAFAIGSFATHNNLRLATGTFQFSGGADVAALMRYNSADSIASVRAALDADARWSAALDATDLHGVTLAAFLGSEIEFSGGVNEQPLDVTEDAGAQTVTARYNPAADEMQDIKAALDAAGFTSWYRGTNVAADSTPETPPFTRPVGPVTKAGAGASTPASQDPLVYIADTASAAPPASEFTQSGRGPVLISWTGNRRVAIAFPATEDAILLIDGGRHRSVTEVAGTIQLGGESYKRIVTSRAIRGRTEGTLIECQIVEDRT